MAPSISPASPEAERFDLPALARFYRWNAPIYDWTRPAILWGRHALLDGLGLRAGAHVLDVGCGTGWTFPRLLEAGARVTGIEPSPSMREKARSRAARLGGTDRVALSDVPFGADDRYRASADRVIFSYSLSMIPPAAAVLEAARDSLRAGGRIGVVDFLDAPPGVREFLETSHVRLGEERLQLLRRTFPRHQHVIRRGVCWRYYLFWGDAAGS